MKNSYSAIREARLRTGLSQSAAATLCGVTKQTFLKWEHGRTSPNLEQVSSISKALDIPVQNLVDNDLNIQLGYLEFHSKFSSLSKDELTRLLFASNGDHHALGKLAASLGLVSG